MPNYELIEVRTEPGSPEKRRVVSTSQNAEEIYSARDALQVPPVDLRSLRYAISAKVPTREVASPVCPECEKKAAASGDAGPAKFGSLMTRFLNERKNFRCRRCGFEGKSEGLKVM